MTRNLDLPKTWAEIYARRPKHVVTADERLEIDNVLTMAGVSADQRRWMTPSCPDVATARRLYPPIATTVMASTNDDCEVAA